MRPFKHKSDLRDLPEETLTTVLRSHSMWSLSWTPFQNHREVAPKIAVVHTPIWNRTENHKNSIKFTNSSDRVTAFSLASLRPTWREPMWIQLFESTRDENWTRASGVGSRPYTRALNWAWILVSTTVSTRVLRHLVLLSQVLKVRAQFRRTHSCPVPTPSVWSNFMGADHSGFVHSRSVLEGSGSSKGFAASW